MAENKTAIVVKDIEKKFKVYLDKGSSLKERILFRNRNAYEERKVIDGVSFEVAKGEAVGLIGHNGCGKSTTLKLLNRIMYPDKGSIQMNGRVSSLIELGAGFHPDMSGRENIYINASIFGLTKKEIDEKIDDIIAFSELEQFMDNPVRTYSSGMYMRLAFAVAINVNADILLIDEILAVGDSNFQNKCFHKLLELRKEGITIVIVSHSLAQIESICDRTIWLHEGKIREDGPCKIVHEEYDTYMRKQELEKYKKQVHSALVTNVQFVGREGEKPVYERTEPVVMRGEYMVQEAKELSFKCAIKAADGTVAFEQMFGFMPKAAEKMQEFQVTMKDMNLLNGEYTVYLEIFEGEYKLYSNTQLRFLVESEYSDKIKGLMMIDCELKL